MRISDGSSDVCSSVLIDEDRVAHREVAHLGTDARAVAVVHRHVAKHEPVDGRALPAQHERGLALAARAVEDRRAGMHRLEGVPQTGSAPCRERGCKYVAVSGWDVT